MSSDALVNVTIRKNQIEQVSRFQILPSLQEQPMSPSNPQTMSSAIPAPPTKMESVQSLSRVTTQTFANGRGPKMIPRCGTRKMPSADANQGQRFNKKITKISSWTEYQISK